MLVSPLVFFGPMEKRRASDESIRRYRSSSSGSSLGTPGTSNPQPTGHCFVAPTGERHGLRSLDPDKACFVSQADEIIILFEAVPPTPPPPAPPSSRSRRLFQAVQRRLLAVPHVHAPSSTHSCASCFAPTTIGRPTSSFFASKVSPHRLWQCQTCPDLFVCDACYMQGVHGFESQAPDLAEAKLDLQLIQLCKAFTLPFLRLLRTRICHSTANPHRRLGRYVNLVYWFGQVVGSTPLAEIPQRGLEFTDLDVDVRQEFVELLRPLLGQRSDLTMNLEWNDGSIKDRGSLRLWVTDTSEASSPFQGILLQDVILPRAVDEKTLASASAM
ncbi:hypothetical protein DYB37_000260 [Aphanomyces astaci]|uniref:ZZ-type domain-containing protein n=1 Tax=Aphanomyces astaci TaxID=112090 RepID=A0A3R7CE41_APHAT|nr:hypothetical protein DYB35_001188 [Aphanomyces astaci]RHZ23345.1 hypothetical protein DYB37_000260 [Aphanomyces astaci]